MASNKVIKKRVKREYKNNPELKIKNGQVWTFHFDVDPDVATKLIEQKELSTPGTQFQYLFNKFLRKGLEEF